jgi:hypothetical protein
VRNLSMCVVGVDLVIMLCNRFAKVRFAFAH